MRLNLTTRARIVGLLLVAAIPLVVLSVYITLDQRAIAEARARQALAQHAQLVSVMVDGLPVSELATPDPLELRPGESLIIVDNKARVLLRFPFDSSPPAEPLGRALLEASAAAGDGVIERRDSSGAHRLYAFRSSVMQTDRSIPVTIAMSTPLSAAYADANRVLKQSVAGIFLVMLTLILCAWFGAERLVVRQIRSLLAMSARLRSGDFAARTGMKAGSEELSQLGSALDRMAEQLERRDAKLNRALEELRTLAVTDVLTGLHNRRYFYDALRRELIGARRRPTVFSVILIDLDNFKRVNDAWGHEAGDVVLQVAADLLRSQVRGSDIAVRYGGEEFALLLPGTGIAVAEQRAEHLRRALEAQQTVYEGDVIRITLSAGVAEYDGWSADASVLMKRVDQALYAAKSAGRNRVTRAPALWSVQAS
jgi:diguanylate cyclase (GGDEF)-like protein